MPTIGIRPTIDGRLGGVRESLEVQTMQMAERVAELFTARLRYRDGSPVQCVIADSTIGGVREAADCETKFQRNGVGLSLTVHVGVMGQKRWIWIRIALKRSGALMVPSDPGRCIWRLLGRA